MNPLSRRSFFTVSAAATAAAAIPALAPRSAPAAAPPRAVDLRDRTRGLLVGSALGDALAGPLESLELMAKLKSTSPPKVWREDERLDAAARTDATQRLQLRPYTGSRSKPEPYGQWNLDAEPGTITDNTRHKLILLDALRIAENKQTDLEARDLARSYVDWLEHPAIRRNSDYPPLAAEWLQEWQFAARWVLGERDLAKARPPERLWQGMPTNAGQMALLPLATLFPGQPERAYRAAWALGFFDNGYGKDLNAAIVAGLATALVTPVDPAAPKTAWETVFEAMRTTDPFGYGKIPWTRRSLDRWLDLALQLATEADHQPGKFFAVLDKGFRETLQWEAQVPFVLVMGCFALADFHPLPALQLTLEWGEENAAFAQLAGAFAGALHGANLFPADARRAVIARLAIDFDVDWEEECALLDRLRREGRTKALIRY